MLTYYRGFLVFLLLLGGIPLTSAKAWAQPASRKFWSHQGDFIPSARESRAQRFETSAGYLFLDGQYISPPYNIALKEGKLSVNGQVTEVLLRHGSRSGDPSRWTSESTPQQGPLAWRNVRGAAEKLAPAERNFERRFPPTSRSERLPNSLRQLADGNVVVLFSGSEPISLDSCNWGSDLLEALIDVEHRETFWKELAEPLVPTKDHERWHAWLSNYVPPPALLTRATPHVEARQNDLAAFELRVQACNVLDRWNVPLNLSAMVLILVSGVHLLASAPVQWGMLGSLQAQAHSARPLAVSLVFVLAMSALDLVWTMLMSQAGMMEELNPIAKLFINEPLQLVAFKSFFTFGAIGIIAGLRRFRPAQIGAWWACLICTLLATRWVAFHTLGV